MKVMMHMHWAGVTPEQYNQARKEVNWEGNPPDGGVFHIAAFDDKGIRVTDIWDSAEQFNTFVQTRLMPGVARIGIKGQPSVELLPIEQIWSPVYSKKRELETA